MAFSFSPSSAFSHSAGLFFGLLLAMVVALPFGSALECYVNEIPDAKTLRPAAAWKLNKLNFGMPSSSNGEESTEKCPAAGDHTTPYCVTIHCKKVFGAKTVKKCHSLYSLMDPVEHCKELALSSQCVTDLKFYCRYCNKDKCNNETVFSVGGQTGGAGGALLLALATKKERMPR